MPILHSNDWASALAADIANWRGDLYLSALTCLPPRTRTASNFGRLWRAIVAAKDPTNRVVLLLPAPTNSSPATLRNTTLPRQLYKLGIDCRLVPGPALLHAKSVLISNTVAWIGSGNFTAAAANQNNELWLRTIDVRVTDELSLWYANLLELTSSQARRPS